MLKCWEEEPNDRPTFQNLRKTMKEMEKKHQVRWLDNMIKMVLHLQEKIHYLIVSPLIRHSTVI